MSLDERQQWTRRHFLKTAAVGAGGLAAGTVMGGCAGARYIREGKQGPAAHTLPFNTHWYFGEAGNAGNQTGDHDDAFQEVTLPHTVADLSWRKWDPKSWERTWGYRRHFTPDKTMQGKRVFMDIGAAMTAATLTINGHEAGRHIGGYLPFESELTDYLVPGDNVLALQLDARFNINVPPDKPGREPTSIDFWQPGGIYRGAYLQVVPPVFLADVFAKPVNVLQDNCRLDIACTVDAAFIPEDKVHIEVQLHEGKNKTAAASVPVPLAEKGKTTVHISLENLREIHLWDIEDPYLYDVTATLFIGNKPAHDHAVRTGFREARFTQKGFYLNGKRVQLLGVNRHQFYPFAGGAMPDRIQRKDAEILRRQLNCNMVRCSHYPQSEAFFDACDEVGLMAWEEAPGWGRPLGDDVWKRRALHAVGQMVRRDRNHPSIIVWGARLNETPDDVPLYTKTRDLAHRLDDSRQTTGAIVGGMHNTKGFVQDVFSFNDYSHSKAPDGTRRPELKPPRTDFPYFVSEAVGTLSGPAKYYRRIDPALAQQGQAMAHARVHNIAGSDERYCGLLAWSGYDYPSGSGNQFEGVKYTGVIDLFREPKPGAAIYQAQTAPEKRPVVVPAFYWDFGPKSLPFSKGEAAMICSNCDRLELFIDGKHYTTAMPDDKRFPHLPYPPSFVDFRKVDGGGKPELRIDGYVGAQKVISRSFASDPSGDRLLVKADDRELHADGFDATRVVFRAADKYGMPRPYVKGNVTLTLEGPAILVGDNPFAFEDAGGVGAVWIRTKPSRPGKISLQVQHPVLGSGTVVIKSRSGTMV